MAKKPEINELTSSYASQGKLNENFIKIAEAFDNTLSRDGSGPNNMQNDLDMDGNDLLNARVVSALDFRINGQRFGFAEALSEAAEQALQAELSAVAALTYANRAEAAEKALLKWQGPWATTRLYNVGDLVQVGGSTYICVKMHISQDFNADLANANWQLFSAKGAAGAGSGDMISDNNLSDLDSVVVARSNLGLGSMATLNASSYNSNQTDWDEGVDTAPHWISPANLQKKLNDYRPSNAPDFTSRMIDMTAGGYTEATHSFGQYPSRIETYLVNIAFENGYSPGDRIPVNPEVNSYDANRGFTMAIRPDLIRIRFANTDRMFENLNMNTGTRVFLNINNWRMLVTAWK